MEPEVLVRFTEPTQSESGDLYWSSAVGQRAEDGLWDGWIEFRRDGANEIISTDRETKQPNRADLVYWAEGLSDVYLQGALKRALAPEPVRLETPAPSVAVPPRSVSRAPETPMPLASLALKTRVVLDPYATYAEGEDLLRSQLHALSHDHLQNIVEAYQMNDGPYRDWARTASDDELVEHIIETVRASIR